MAGPPLGASYNAGLYKSPYAFARGVDISTVRPADLAEALCQRVSAPMSPGYPNQWTVHNVATAKCVTCDRKLSTGVVCGTCHETRFCLDCFQKGSSRDGLWQNLEGCWCQYGEQSLNPQVFDPDTSQHYESLRALTANYYQDHSESISIQGRPAASQFAQVVASASLPADATTGTPSLMLPPSARLATMFASNSAMPATSVSSSASEPVSSLASALASQQEQAQQSDITPDVRSGSLTSASMHQRGPVYAGSQDGLVYSAVREVSTPTAAPAGTAVARSPPADKSISYKLTDEDHAMPDMRSNKKHRRSDDEGDEHGHIAKQPRLAPAA